jgi:GntR family transcriptional regulator
LFPATRPFRVRCHSVKRLEHIRNTADLFFATMVGRNRRERGLDDARRLRDLLRAEVKDAVFDEGRLPSEEQLMADYRASRATVRSALDLLRDEGLVERLPGVGTHATQEFSVVDLGEQHGVVDKPQPAGLWGGRQRPNIIDWREVPMPPVGAAALGCAPGIRTLRVDYVAWFDGAPMGMATNYVRFPEGERLKRDRFVTDWYALLESGGLTISETTFLMEAALSDIHDEALLHIPIGFPIMLMEQVIYDENGAAYNFATTRGRSDRIATLSRQRRSPA